MSRRSELCGKVLDRLVRELIDFRQVRSQRPCSMPEGQCRPTSAAFLTANHSRLTVAILRKALKWETLAHPKREIFARFGG